MKVNKKIIIAVASIAVFLLAIIIGVVILLTSKDRSEANDQGGKKHSYVDESRYSKDIQELKAIEVAMSILIADPESDWSIADNKVTTLKALIDVGEKNSCIMEILQEVFDEDGKFDNSSSAFEGVTTEDVYIKIINGVAQINVKSKDKTFKDYQAPKGISLFE